MGKTMARRQATAGTGVEQRWSKAVADAGWTAVPNVLLDKQVALGLDALDVNIVMQIAKYWWSSDAPYPSVDTISEAIGVTARTVQRRIARMEEDGLVERHTRFYAKGGGQRSNQYTFDGLIERCTPFAKEITKGRAKQKAIQKARVRRRKPLDDG